MVTSFIRGIQHVMGAKAFPRQMRNPVVSRACRDDNLDGLMRLRLTRKAMAFRIQPLFRIDHVVPAMKPVAEIMNDVHFFLADYFKISERLRMRISAISMFRASDKPLTWRENRTMVIDIIKFIMDPKDGLGFKPTETNSAASAVLLYNFLREAGLCARIMLNKSPLVSLDRGPQYCVEVVINPHDPSRKTIIDLSCMLLDRNITSDSIIDFYDVGMPLKMEPADPSTLSVDLAPGRR